MTNGAVAGVFGALAMTAVYYAWPGRTQPSEPGSIAATYQETDGATETLVEKVSNQPLSKQIKKPAGRVVHYLFGAGMGAFYEVIRPQGYHPFLAMAYGSGIFILGRQISVPLLGLSHAATPASLHLHSWVAHLAYGLTLENALKDR